MRNINKKEKHRTIRDRNVRVFSMVAIGMLIVIQGKIQMDKGFSKIAMVYSAGFVLFTLITIYNVVREAINLKHFEKAMSRSVILADSFSKDISKDLYNNFKLKDSEYKLCENIAYIMDAGFYMLNIKKSLVLEDNEYSTLLVCKNEHILSKVQTALKPFVGNRIKEIVVIRSDDGKEGLILKGFSYKYYDGYERTVKEFEKVLFEQNNLLQEVFKCLADK